MSHTNFSFLMALEADAFLGDDDERRESISEEFSERFGNRLDENNWFHHITVFFKDGSYVMWPKSEPGIFADIAKENRWDAVRLYALQCVAVDFRLFGATPWSVGDSGNEGNQKIDVIEFDDLLSEIYRQIPASLSERYLCLKDKTASSSEIPEESWKAEHERRKLVLMFEAFRNSNHVPFTAWPMVTAYEFRAFDITWGEEPNAILITDIHT